MAYAVKGMMQDLTLHNMQRAEIISEPRLALVGLIGCVKIL